MKKITLTLLACATLCGVISLTSCNKNDINFEMDKRYIYKNDVNKSEYTERFLIFHSNGKGQCTDYYVNKDLETMNDKKYYKFIIDFNWTYIDREEETVACFFNDVFNEYDGDDSNYYYISNVWSIVLSVSKNALMTIDYETDRLYTNYLSDLWINEDYVKTIPNYRS